MMRLFSIFVSGLMFAAGLVIAGMTQPSKVIGFLDWFGAWDPSLAFVMLGAILVHAVGYRLIRRRSAPVFALNFQVPTRKDVDGPLLAGSALFGVGWGLGGFCPGPAVSSVVALQADALVFVGSLVGTWIAYSLVTGRASGVTNRASGDRELGTAQTIELTVKS